MKRPTLYFLALSCLVLTLGGAAATRAAAPADDSATTLYRDEYGIPHVYAPTLEAASYAVGYAQAEDRLEELLKNYRRASGHDGRGLRPASSMRTTSPSAIWRHEEISRTRYHQVSPKMRAVLEAYSRASSGS